MRSPLAVRDFCIGFSRAFGQERRIQLILTDNGSEFEGLFAKALEGARSPATTPGHGVRADLQPDGASLSDEPRKAWLAECVDT